MFEDQLLKEKERPFVRDLLAHLDERFPRILRRDLGAVRTLSVLNDVLDLKYLLQYSGGENLDDKF